MSEQQPNRGKPRSTTMGGVIGAGLGRMARHAVNPKDRQKVLRAAGIGLQATANSVRKTTHTLWLEVTGFFFLVFATVCGGAAWREYQQVLAGKTQMNRVYLAGALALLFVWFGVSSFWRARRR